jgi:hypothetical protein
MVTVLFLFITVSVDLEESDDSTYTFDGHEGKFLHKDQMESPLLVEPINLFLCLYVIMVPCSYSPIPFPCTDEVFALACSPTDALLVALEAKMTKDSCGGLDQQRVLWS